MRLHQFALVAGLGLSILGCSSMQETSSQPMEKSQAETMEMAEHSMASLYEVHRDNRIYLFYDHDLYTDFVKTGHTAYMFTQIGAGPQGETMVYALTGDDKKKREGIPSVELLAAATAPESFYGETVSDGRIYVFDSLEIMNEFRQTGEATYRYTDIGAGPNGETVVYVLSKEKSKEKPVGMIDMFRKMKS